MILKELEKLIQEIELKYKKKIRSKAEAYRVLRKINEFPVSTGIKNFGTLVPKSKLEYYRSFIKK